LKDFILQKNLKCHEVAGFGDGWFSALSELKLFELFEQKSVNNNIQKILYNSIIGKTPRINTHYYLYYLPGNIPKLIDDYDIMVEISQLFKSFRIFIEMSLFNLVKNTK
jgi:hypothetical protein